MSKLWLILGFISLGAAIIIYQDQAIILQQPWDWGQLFSWIHHETLIAVFISVGITLLVVGIVNKGGER